MLLSLHVKNLAIIDEVEVFFKDKLNILTGETGAGKSIIIGSINIALGGKVPKDIIRKGTDYALIELVFQVSNSNLMEVFKENDLPWDDGQVIISKKIFNNRSVAKINGETVPNSIVKEIADYLIDIHGQHEHQSLLHKHKHLMLVDEYGKNDISEIKNELHKLYHEWRELKFKLDAETMDEDKRLREISFLEYEIKEIEEARLKEGEYEELESLYRKISTSSTTLDLLSETYEATGYDSKQSAGELISNAVKTLNRCHTSDESVKEFTSQIMEIESLLNDFNRDLVEYMESLNFCKEEFEDVEKRLNLWNGLKAKFGNSYEEIMQYYNNNVIKLEKYQDYENYLHNLKIKISQLEDEIITLSVNLSSNRKKYADELCNKIKEALIDLNFLDVKFSMNFVEMKSFTANGKDDAEFIISTNPGEELKPLSKVASGGELSRIMLAIKSIMASEDSIDTLIFDEIDVGVSGRTAQKVSEKLSTIAKNHQVLCITHLPQITAMADSHYLIEKITENNKTNTTIRELKEKESICELARILGGAVITDNVLASAKEMKELAANTK